MNQDWESEGLWSVVALVASSSENAGEKWGGGKGIPPLYSSFVEVRCDHYPTASIERCTEGDS